MLEDTPVDVGIGFVLTDDHHAKEGDTECDVTDLWVVLL